MFLKAYRSELMGDVWKQEARENFKTVKHQQFTKHLVGEGLGIEGGWGEGA